MKALEPREVNPSQNGSPYMFRLILGWCVVGPMQYEKSSDTSSCNRIMVTAVG